MGSADFTSKSYHEKTMQEVYQAEWLEDDESLCEEDVHLILGHKVVEAYKEG
jgi:hypothetical protein